MKRYLRALAVLMCFVFFNTHALMAESVKLNLFFYKQEIKDALGEMAAAFSKSHPGISLELEMVPNDSLTVLKTRFASGNSPDIVQLQSYSQIFEFAKAGYLLDLSRESVIAKVIDDSKASVTYNGKVYALPMDFAGIGIIYNKKIFNKFGLKPPKTYSELKKVARTLKSKGITPFAGLLKANWSAGHFITLLHASLTSSPGKTFAWMDKMNKGQGSWNDPIQGKVDRLFSIMDFYKTNMASNAVEMDWNEQQAAFAGETAAMMVQGLWSYGAAIGTNPKLDAGFTPFPASYRKQETKFFADVDSTFAISSTIGPEKTKAAKAFLNWLSSKEGIKMWTEKCKLTSTFKGADVSGMKQPFIDLMTHVNQNGAYPWEFAMYPSSVFEDAAKNGAQEYFFGKKTAEQVVGYIDSSWRKAVGQ